MFVVCCLLCVDCCVMSVACFLPSVAFCCVSIVVCCLMLVGCCSLHDFCLLCVVVRYLFAVCRLHLDVYRCCGLFVV